MLSPTYMSIIIGSLSSLGLIIIAPCSVLGMNLNIDEKIDKIQDNPNINRIPTISSPALTSLNPVQPLKSFGFVPFSKLSSSTVIFSSDVQPSLTSSSALIQYNIEAEFQQQWEQELIRSQTDQLNDFYVQNTDSSQDVSLFDHNILEVPEPDLVIGLELIGLGLLGAALRNLT